jgi:hypothetical protein
MASTTAKRAPGPIWSQWAETNSATPQASRMAPRISATMPCQRRPAGCFCSFPGADAARGLRIQDAGRLPAI